MSVRFRIAAGLIAAVALVFSALCAPADAKRRLSVGDETPEFGVKDLKGRPFEYSSKGKRILMVAFLSSKRDRTAQVAEDLENVFEGIQAHSDKVDVVVVVSDANESYFKSPESGAVGKFHIVLDKDFELWGKFGIIVTPTVVLSGADGKIAWVKAGYSLTFEHLLRAELNAALGITQEVDPNEAGQVQAIDNATVDARIKRHLHMADMLKRKGRLDSAAEQLRLAFELDPNSVDVAMVLADLHLRGGHGGKALGVIARLAAKAVSDKARLLLASGRVKCKAGELDEAEKSLLEATKLEPDSSFALFELGKVYEARGQASEATKAYRRALTLIFGDMDEAKPPAVSEKR